ncbi:MAG: IPT/TIG domain-containing protein [Deltaproteobacteria bacterium]|nr:IPT/TIG domain-containing protein [Deltaproteobacteria bacterium]
MRSLRLRHLRSAAFVAATFATASFAACLPGGGPRLLEPEEGSTTPIDLGGDSGLQRSDVDLGDPFALEGLSPSHGPFTGGTRARLSGRGFTTKLRVFLGDVEVPPSSFVAGDPTRAAVITPPGRPGFVDVRIRDDATAKERVLKNGFYYDAFVVAPDTGATSGGTRIRLTGSGTSWEIGTKVAIGGVACTNVLVSNPTTIECLTPASSPGAKDVTVTTPDGKTAQARDGFTYSDAPDGYRGGLSGGAFAGTVRVLAFDSLTGSPLPGSYVVAGSSIAGGVVKTTSASGVAEINGLPGSKVTITIGSKCHQPITYVDVPVDTVIAYLPIIRTPSCIPDPESLGGGGPGGRFGGIVEGQIVFPGGAEFQRAGWTTVPAPTRPTERRAAYVFSASSNPGEAFALPPATEAITPDAEGKSGYAFSTVVFPGNATIYVVAGLEDRSAAPPRFIPYAMGVAKGISVPAQTRVVGVDVKMDILFDKQVTIAAQPPAPGPRGPDRLLATAAVTLGSAGYAIVPRGYQIVPFPAPPTLPLTGVPSLDYGLTGEQYVLGAAAATGADLQRPVSVVSRVRTTNASDPITLSGFIGVPVLDQPGAGAWNGTHVEFTGATGAADLGIVSVSSSYGLVTWTIVAPAGVKSYDVPDLNALPIADKLGIVPGPITTTVTAARVDGFSYARLRSGQLTQGSWNAYAVDTLSGAY